MKTILATEEMEEYMDVHVILPQLSGVTAAGTDIGWTRYILYS